MNTCKNCSQWARISYNEIKDRITGEVYSVGSLNGKPDYDPEKYELITSQADAGRCNSHIVIAQLDPGTTYGDGVTFHEDFGCIHHEPK